MRIQADAEHMFDLFQNVRRRGLTIIPVNAELEFELFLNVGGQELPVIPMNSRFVSQPVMRHFHPFLYGNPVREDSFGMSRMEILQSLLNTKGRRTWWLDWTVLTSPVLRTGYDNEPVAR